MPHPVINIEIKKYYQNESRFTGVYSGHNLPKNIKDWPYVINRDKYANEFITFMLVDKTLVDYTSLFLSYNFDKNDNTTSSYFKNE